MEALSHLVAATAPLTDEGAKAAAAAGSAAPGWWGVRSQRPMAAEAARAG